MSGDGGQPMQWKISFKNLKRQRCAYEKCADAVGRLHHEVAKTAWVPMDTLKFAP